ncbi:AAA family ATPase [soil metagenome]
MTETGSSGEQASIPLLVVTAGLPASGKSTIAEVIGNRLGIPVLSVDPIEAAILGAGIDVTQPTGLAAYLVAEAMAEGVLASGSGVVIDAVNAVEPARDQWVRLAARQEVTLRFLEVVCSDPEIHRERLAARVGRHAKADSAFAVEQSLQEWEPWTGAAASVPRVTLDSMRPLGVNIEQALAFLSS